MGRTKTGSFGSFWRLRRPSLTSTHAEVIHCDIKPSNVYIAARDGPHLFDFGSRSHREREALRGGTLAYMAPEQLHAMLDPRRWAEVGPAVDIYALGLTLGELYSVNCPTSPPATFPSPELRGNC